MDIRKIKKLEAGKIVTNISSITSKRFHELADEIIKIFPTESPSTYYIGFGKDSVTNKKINAGGILYWRYHHWRGILLSAGVVKKSQGIKRKHVDYSGAVCHAYYEDLLVEDESNEQHKINLDWLKNNIDPWSTVKKLWSESSKIRIKQLVDNKQYKSFEYFDNYPALRHAVNGLILINIDFITQYPHKNSILEEQYPSFEAQILKYCEKLKKKSKQLKYLLELLEQNENISEDSKQSIIFRIIPLLMPQPPQVQHKKIFKKFDKEEIQNDFLLYAKDEASLKQQLKKRSEELVKYNLPVQPIPAIIGESLLSIEKHFVIINNIEYAPKSTLEAIDMTFKSFYSFQLEYSPISKYVWSFIQKSIYCITGETDRNISCLENILSNIKNSY